MFPRSAHASLRLVLVLAAGAQPACSVYDASMLDPSNATLISAGGSSIGGELTAGAPNGGTGTTEAGSSGASVGGESGHAATGGGGTGSSSNAGAGGSGSAGAGSSSGAASTGGGGASSGTGGTTSAKGGAGGTASTGGGGASAGSGATGGGGVPGIDPCSRANWTASASESSLTMTPPQLYNPPVDAIDGNSDSRWSSGAAQVGGETFTIDLGAVASHLTQIVLDTTAHPTDYPANYKLEIGSTTANYTVMATGSGSSLTTIKFTDKPGRYLRITQTGTSASWWSIHEISISCQSN
jgi:hypothetical protein